MNIKYVIYNTSLDLELELYQRRIADSDAVVELKIISHCKINASKNTRLRRKKGRPP